MLRVDADHAYHTGSLDDLALIAHLLNTGPNFHCVSSQTPRLSPTKGRLSYQGDWKPPETKSPDARENYTDEPAPMLGSREDREEGPDSRFMIRRPAAQELRATLESATHPLYPDSAPTPSLRPAFAP